MKFNSSSNSRGFTLIELIVVLVLIGALAAFALPRFGDLRADARNATLEGIAGSMRSTIGILRSVAVAQGLSTFDSNPGNQAQLIVTTEAGSSELDWRNLCPESSAELGDALDMIDHIGFDDASGDPSDRGGIDVETDNRFTRVGYIIGGTTNNFNGCYVLYDSFGDPNCEVRVINNQCDL